MSWHLSRGIRSEIPRYAEITASIQGIYSLNERTYEHKKPQIIT